MPDWIARPLLSSAIQQRADSSGNLMSAPDIESSSTIIDPRISDFILYGVFNGAFARGPDNPNAAIEIATNPLPDWAGPTQVSGGAITASWVVDASSPSGYNLRFSIAPGAAGDEAYFEQIVPVGGTRNRRFASYLRAVAYRVTASGGAPLLVMGTQYLTAGNATTGSSVEATTALSADATAYTASGYVATAGAQPPADGYFLRIRIGVRRNTMAAADTATIDLTDVRQDRGAGTVVIAEQTSPDSYGPGVIIEGSGSMFLRPNASATTLLQIDSFTGNFNIYADNDIYMAGDDVLIKEVAAPGTPASGWYAVYAKTDGILYGKDDSGNETVLGGGSGKVTVYTSGAGNSWTPLPGSRSCRVILFGAGAGGSSGAQGTNAAVRCGGTGGGGGSMVVRDFRISDLTTPVTVAIGTGGPGGTASAAAGNDGTAGGNTTFGSYLKAWGGGQGLGPTVAPTADSGGSGGGWGGVGAVGVTAADSTGGLPGQTAGAIGLSGQGGGSDRANQGQAAEYGGGGGGGHGNGADADRPGGTSIFGGAGGGAGGNGGISQNNGSAGGNTGVWTAAGGGGGALGAARTNGTDGASGAGVKGGTGGGGGGGSTAGSVGAGGAGGLYGGGGGGGGGCVSGNSGAGGAGGNGGAIIFEW